MGYDDWSPKQKDLLKTRLDNIDSKGNYKGKLKKRIENINKNGLVDKNFKSGCKACDGIPNEPDCLIGPYKDIKEGCNGDAHHVRPDLMSRFPGVKGNPVSHDDAIAICVHPIAHKKTHSQMYVGWGGIRKNGKAPRKEAVAETHDALRKQGGQKKKGSKKTSPSQACIEKAIKSSYRQDFKSGFNQNATVRATTRKIK